MVMHQTPFPAGYDTQYIQILTMRDYIFVRLVMYIMSNRTVLPRKSGIETVL